MDDFPGRRGGDDARGPGGAIRYPAAVIRAVACALTAAGMQLGTRAGKRFGKRIEIAGGVTLLAVGLKILVEHLPG